MTTHPDSVLTQRDASDRLVALWLHGRGRHTQAAYRADVAQFRAFVEKPLELVTLAAYRGVSKGGSPIDEEEAARFGVSHKDLLLAHGGSMVEIRYDPMGGQYNCPVCGRTVPEKEHHVLLAT